MKVHPVWDVSVRCFHWINVVSVLGLIAVGVAILNDKALGVTNDGKILLKTVHVWIGYVFALNLLWRFVWGSSVDLTLAGARSFRADPVSRPIFGATPPISWRDGRVSISATIRWVASR